MKRLNILKKADDKYRKSDFKIVICSYKTSFKFILRCKYLKKINEIINLMKTNQMNIFFGDSRLQDKSFIYLKFHLL